MIDDQGVYRYKLVTRRLSTTYKGLLTAETRAKADIISMSAFGVKGDVCERP